MYIETPRMVIRDFTPEDATDLYDILGDDGTMEYCEPAYDFICGDDRHREICPPDGETWHAA